MVDVGMSGRTGRGQVDRVRTCGIRALEAEDGAVGKVDVDAGVHQGRRRGVSTLSAAGPINCLHPVADP